eukprot:365261-Chlamydomonas_euryale.AAC.7
MPPSPASSRSPHSSRTGCIAASRHTATKSRPLYFATRSASAPYSLSVSSHGTPSRACRTICARVAASGSGTYTRREKRESAASSRSHGLLVAAMIVTRTSAALEVWIPSMNDRNSFVTRLSGTESPPPPPPPPPPGPMPLRRPSSESTCGGTGRGFGRGGRASVSVTVLQHLLNISTYRRRRMPLFKVVSTSNRCAILNRHSNDTPSCLSIQQVSRSIDASKATGNFVSQIIFSAVKHVSIDLENA